MQGLATVMVGTELAFDTVTLAITAPVSAVAGAFAPGLVMVALRVACGAWPQNKPRPVPRPGGRFVRTRLGTISPKHNQKVYSWIKVLLMV